MSDQWRTTLSGVRTRASEWWRRARASEWWRRARSALTVAPPPDEPEPEEDQEAPAEPPASPLYRHTAHHHAPRNVNHVHRAERERRAAKGGVTALNEHVAVWLTAYVGTMWTAYGFAALAIVGLFGVLAILSPSVYTLIAWLSQTFIQLVLLPVIMVGQNVLNRHAELQSDEMFHDVVRLLHEMDQNQRHLVAQDEELLKQTRLLLRLAGEPAEAPAPAPAAAPERPAPEKRLATRRKATP